MAQASHVVIVGGGFGGLRAAKALKRAPVRVTLIDRRNFARRPVPVTGQPPCSKRDTPKEKSSSPCEEEPNESFSAHSPAAL